MSRSLRKHIKCFILRFWPLIIWILFTTGIFWKTYRNFKTKPQYYYLRNMLGCWLCISRGTAPVLTMCSLLVLLPVCRSLHTMLHGCLAKISSRLLAAWLSKVKIMHTVCATTLIIFSLIHTGAHIMNAIYFSKHYTDLYPDINLARYKGENPALLICTWTGYSGIGMLILLLLMTVTSVTKFRTKHFNTFYITHHLFVLYLLLLLTHPISGILKEQYNVHQHIPGCIMPKNTTILEGNIPESIKVHRNYCTQPPQFKCIPTKIWIWVVIALLTYTIELGYRKYRGNPMEAIQACHVIQNAMHLRLKCSKHYSVDPGQYILLQCDKISRVEWHPFTVTQCPRKEQLSFEVLISVRGDWTKDLHTQIKLPFCFDACDSYISRFYHKPLTFLVDGPFASPMQAIKRSKYAICVAAGIGITSYVATLRQMMITKSNIPKRLHLLWLTRDPKQLMWYAKLLNDLQRKFWDDNQPDRFQVQLYVTKDYHENEVNNIFKNHSLRSRIHIGRPNWKKEFQIWNFLYKRNKVSLFCCGPNSLTNELRRRCLKASRKGNKYTLIHEGF
ncbi:Dual oxidase [Carabus blaptoides fortunei]